jgi:hypothetical protein
MTEKKSPALVPGFLRPACKINSLYKIHVLRIDNRKRCGHIVRQKGSVMSKLSRTALLEFQDYLSKKGLMNKATAAARKAAVNKVLGILDEAESGDVSALDIDKVMSRFHNLEGSKYTPSSLSIYKSRIKSAIDDFLRYQKDPMNFKPAGQNPGRAERAKTPSSGEGSARPESRNAPIEAPPAAVNIIPIPIRPDLTIKIQGLPFDLTASEANKIANVIKAMASGD